MSTYERDPVTGELRDIAGRTPVMIGATSQSNGTGGSLPAPLAGQEHDTFMGDGSYQPRSYVGMVIHSTTLDTMAKVVAFYGGTTWILHSGYMLRGASTNVTAKQAQSNGGQDTVTPSGTNSGGSVSSHTLTVNEMPSHGHSVAVERNFGGGGSGWSYSCVDRASTRANDYGKGSASNTGGSQGHSHGFTQPTFTGDSHTNLPKYKNVYIWERTA